MSKVTISGNASGTGTLIIAAPNTNSDITLNLPTTMGTNNGSSVVTTDAAGNLGLGVAPSAWGGTQKAIQIGTSALSAYTNAPQYVYLSTNWVNNSGDKYIATGAAAVYAQDTGRHQWYTAPSGTAGAAISFTQAMTLDASGNLGVGTTSPQAKLHLSGGSVSMRLGGNGASDWANFGYDGTAYIYTPSTQPILFYTNNTERARIDSSGNFSISNNAGATVAAFIRNKGVGATGSGAFSLPYTTVNFTPGAASSNIYWDGNTGWLTLSTSSQKYKRNITAITDQQLDKALQLKPAYYQRLEYDYWEYGFIAEEVNDIGLDEFVTKVDGEISGLNYEKMITLAIGLIQRQDKAIQELKAIVDAQGAEIATLKGTA